MSIRSRVQLGFGFGAQSVATFGFITATAVTGGTLLLALHGTGGASKTTTFIEETHQLFANFDRSLAAEVDRKLRRRKEEEELVMILAAAVTKRLLH